MFASIHPALMDAGPRATHVQTRIITASVLIPLRALCRGLSSCGLIDNSDDRVAAAFGKNDEIEQNSVSSSANTAHICCYEYYHGSGGAVSGV